MTNLSEKICPGCGANIYGRIDKKFCSDQCRSTYHRSVTCNPECIRKINAILRRNWRILATFDTVKDDQAVPATLLRIRGFDFNFYTNRVVKKDGTSRFYCYDKAYEEAGDDAFRLLTDGTALKPITARLHEFP